MYKKFFKRFLDFTLSLCALIVLLPLIVILAVVGAVAMKGNPFFVQPRAGMIDKKTGREKIIYLIKFRTMANLFDKDHNLLPDDVRLTKYGKLLRMTSLDELPELINILVGDMSIVGPRPLLVRYLDRYNEEQHHRHDVKPGLTGYAQTHGRNALSWEVRFAMDVWYTQNVTFSNDAKIFFDTIRTVLSHEGISSADSATMEEFMGTPEGVKTAWKISQ